MLNERCRVSEETAAHFHRADVIDEETGAEVEQAKTDREIARYEATIRDAGRVCEAANAGSAVEDAADIMANEIAGFDGEMDEYMALVMKVGMAFIDGVNEQARFEATNNK